MSDRGVIVIFRSRLRPDGEKEYLELAPRILALAEAAPGFRSIDRFRSDEGERVSIIAFDSLDHVAAWRDQADHRIAQRLGRERFYSEYSIQVCAPIRAYSFDGVERRAQLDPSAT